MLKGGGDPTTENLLAQALMFVTAESGVLK